jgi:predicted RNA polymerase sigma factor
VNAPEEPDSSPLEPHFADEIADEALRLIFICRHEAVPAESTTFVDAKNQRFLAFGTVAGRSK